MAATITSPPATTLIVNVRVTDVSMPPLAVPPLSCTLNENDGRISVSKLDRHQVVAYDLAHAAAAAGFGDLLCEDHGRRESQRQDQQR